MCGSFVAFLLVEYIKVGFIFNGLRLSGYLYQKRGTRVAHWVEVWGLKLKKTLELFGGLNLSEIQLNWGLPNAYKSNR